MTNVYSLVVKIQQIFLLKCTKLVMVLLPFSEFQYGKYLVCKKTDNVFKNINYSLKINIFGN